MYNHTMKYNMFIDDQVYEINTDTGCPFRDPKDYYPEQVFVLCESFAKAIEFIENNGCPTFISFDHDLGCDDQGIELMNGYDLAKWLVEADLNSNGAFIPKDFAFQVHSKNPIGKANIINLLSNYLKQR